MSPFLNYCYYYYYGLQLREIKSLSVQGVRCHKQIHKLSLCSKGKLEGCFVLYS